MPGSTREDEESTVVGGAGSTGTPVAADGAIDALPTPAEKEGEDNDDDDNAGARKIAAPDEDSDDGIT